MRRVNDGALVNFVRQILPQLPAANGTQSVGEASSDTESFGNGTLPVRILQALLAWTS